MIGIFLDDVTPCNAPVLAIPGSHKDGLVSEAIIDENLVDHKGAAKFRFDITDDTLSQLVDRQGIKSIEGPARNCAFNEYGGRTRVFSKYFTVKTIIALY